MSEKDSGRGLTSIAILAVLMPVLVLAWMNQQPASTRKAKRTKHLMIAVIASNTINYLIDAVLMLGCGFCAYRISAYFISGAIVKGVNLLFLVHRAKLVQGMAPVLSVKWFEKIFPGLTTGLVIVFIFLIIKGSFATEYECAPNPDWNTLQQCNMKSAGSSGQSTAIMGIGLDLVITIFLMILFIVPLYRVSHADIGVMNANQLKQRKKLRDLLIWSIFLTFVNQVSSSLKFVDMALPSQTSRILSRIGKFDPAINIWTSWLMITRNRQYSKRMYLRLCCPRSKEGLIRQQTQSVALTDIASANDSRSSGLAIERQQSKSQQGLQYSINPDSTARPVPSS